MKIKNIFEHENVTAYISRLDNLDVSTKPLWGKMNAAQMLAHVNISYEQARQQEKASYSWLTKWVFRVFIKGLVVGNKPYKKNSKTAPSFIIADEKDFLKEKQQLVVNMKEVLGQGPSYFEGKESSSFGKLSAKEWNNLFSKHLEHHFSQFGI